MRKQAGDHNPERPKVPQAHKTPNTSPTIPNHKPGIKRSANTQADQTPQQLGTNPQAPGQ